MQLALAKESKVNVLSSILNATPPVFSKNSLDEDPSQTLKQRWAQTSASDACRLIDDPGVLLLLRAMRGDSEVGEEHCTQLAQYLTGEQNHHLPYSLFRMPEGGITLAEESRTLLHSLLHSDVREAPSNNRHKLETLLGLMERLETTRSRRNERSNVSVVAPFNSNENEKDKCNELRGEEGIRFVRKGVPPCVHLHPSGIEKDKNPQQLLPGAAGSSTDANSEKLNESQLKTIQDATDKVPTTERGKVLPLTKKVSHFAALASGDLGPIVQALQSPKLTSRQVLDLLTPTDDQTRPALRSLIGARTGNAEELARKREAFKVYVARLKEHAPRLTASQLKSLYQYLHLSQTVKGIFWNRNSPGYNQLMEDRALYDEYRDLKTLLKNATLPGRSDLDMGYKKVSAEIRAVARRLKDSALDDAQRHELLVSAQADGPSLLRRLLELPITSAFSIEYKRSAFRKYLSLLAHHTPGLSPEQGKRLYGALLDSQKVPAGLFGRTNSEGYRQVMKDKALRQEYTMLTTCLAHGSRMQDTPTGQRFLIQMQRFQHGPTLFTDALSEE